MENGNGTYAQNILDFWLHMQPKAGRESLGMRLGPLVLNMVGKPDNHLLFAIGLNN